jgi:hypothetical protein
MKLECVADYNVPMHGVDSGDQYSVLYSFMRKTAKWPMKVFFCLLQSMLFISFPLLQKQPRSKDGISGRMKIV